MKTFLDVAKWLFERAPKGYNPQIGLARANKVGYAWFPGNHAYGEVDTANTKYIGCTPRAYQWANKPQHEQDCYICWAGIDIDAKHNPDYTLDDLYRVVRAAAGPAASIRTSTGGLGLHVFYRLDEPLHIEAGQQNVLSPIAKSLVADHWLRIKEAGIAPDKCDSRMFWVWGGRNRWLRISDEFVSTSGIDKALGLGMAGAKSPSTSMPCKYVECSGFVRSWLDRLKVSPGPVYIGDIVPRLWREGERVETRSTMRGNGQKNGLLIAGRGWIELFSSPDGGIIWRIEDVAED